LGNLNNEILYPDASHLLIRQYAWIMYFKNTKKVPSASFSYWPANIVAEAVVI
jgi:hypothetical protein